MPADVCGGAVTEDEGERWWTIPQAVVWIRTRDLSAVQALDGRQRVSLFMAADMIPGVFPAATDCLRQALERGRLAVRGRMALPELAVAGGEMSYRLLGDQPEMVPEGFWQSGGAFTDDLDHGVVATAPGAPERWMDLVVAVDDCVGHWQGPESVLGQGRMPMNRVLPTEPDDVAHWLLAHPDVVVTGVDGAGARVAIERGMFNNPLLIDRQNGVLMTQDGRATWRAVELELASSRAPSADAEPLARWRNRPVPAPLKQSSPAAPGSAAGSTDDAAAHAGEPRVRRRHGQKGHQRAAAKAYLKEAFPHGVPASVSVSAIEAALKARGTPVSARTIRRAMGAR
jgi:hypothetical protein